MGLCSLVLGEARALFTSQHPKGHEYDVVISKTHGDAGYEYEARLIVYTGHMLPGIHGEWVMLVVNPCLCESPVDAMADLLENLYERAGKAQVGLKEGETFRGAL